MNIFKKLIAKWKRKPPKHKLALPFIDYDYSKYDGIHVIPPEHLEALAQWLMTEFDWDSASLSEVYERLVSDATQLRRSLYDTEDRRLQ